MRRRRGTQKLSGKRTGFGRYSEKAGRRRPTTEGATSRAEGISQVTKRGHRAVKSGFVSFFAARKTRNVFKEERRMSELKRTQLYDVHVAAGAEMVDFGGW